MRMNGEGPGPGTPAKAQAIPMPPRFRPFHREFRLPECLGTIDISDSPDADGRVVAVLRPSSTPLHGTQSGYGATAVEALRGMARHFAVLARVLGEFADEEEVSGDEAPR